MKQKMEEDKPDIVNFSLKDDYQEVYQQADYLLSYYVTKLKILKKNSLEGYVTAEKAPEEAFYKDMISSCMLFISDYKKIKKNYETTIRESETISRGFPAE